MFLIVNGLILFCGEKFRSRASLQADQEVAAQRGGALAPAIPASLAARPSVHGRPCRAAITAAGQQRRRSPHAGGHQAVRREEISHALASDERLSRMGFVEALIIGTSQVLALLAGISRDGVTMVDRHGPGPVPGGRGPVRVPARHPGHPGRRGAQGARPDWARSVTGSAARSCSAACCPGSARTSRCGSCVRYFQTRTLYPFAAILLSRWACSA